MDSPEPLVTGPQAQEEGSENSNTSKDVLPETTIDNSTTGPQAHENGGGNTYVDILPEKQGIVAQSPIPFQITQSQKRRRRFIPFRYHSKIFKNSKKKANKNGNELSVFKGADPHKHGTRHAIEDNRPSTNSSSYASCRPFRNTCNESCHTYLDIDEFRDHRGIGLNHCNSISTVSTLPMHVVSTLQTCGEDEHAGRQVVYREEQPSATMTPKMDYEMKVPDKRKGVKKYMVLFCIVLVSIVVSTVVAGYVGTKNVVKDIPTAVKQKFQEMPELKIIKEQTNLTVIESLLDNGLSDFTIKLKAFNEKHFENLTDKLELNLDISKNEIKMHNELIEQRVLNETASKEDVLKSSNETKLNLDLLRKELKEHNELIEQLILNETASKEDVKKSSNETKLNLDLLRKELKEHNELIEQRILNETASKEDIKKSLFTISEYFLSWKEEIQKFIFTMIHSSICVNNCTGHPQGNYQSCYTCHGYVACINDKNLKNMTCSRGEGNTILLWDNMKGTCERTSLTCHQAYI